MDKNKIKEFADRFETKIFTTIQGTDGNGINRLRKIVEDKKEEVLKRKLKRNQ